MNMIWMSGVWVGRWGTLPWTPQVEALVLNPDTPTDEGIGWWYSYVCYPVPKDFLSLKERKFKTLDLVANRERQAND